MGWPNRPEPFTLYSMSVHVEFHGGPADGTVEEYRFSTALPSLYWSRDEPDRVAAIYRRSSEQPDPITGAWRYSLATA